MTSQHKQFLELAKRLIAANGRLLFLVRTVNTGPRHNPVQGEEVMGVIGFQSEYREFESEQVRVGDKRFLIAGDMQVTTDMRIRDYGPSREPIELGVWAAGIDAFGAMADARVLKDYSIINVSEVQPGATSIMYKVQARA